MARADESPWARLAALTLAAVTLAVLVRTLRGAGHVALDELRYRARDPDVVLKWVT